MKLKFVYVFRRKCSIISGKCNVVGSVYACFNICYFVFLLSDFALRLAMGRCFFRYAAPIGKGGHDTSGT